MRGLHIAVLLRKPLKDYFELEKRVKMRAGGICNTMGNKGAISVEFTLLGQSFQVINCHLAASQEESPRRNETVNRVLDELVRKDAGCEVIFLGDFNYRIEMGKEEYKQIYANRPNTEDVVNYCSMIDRDQLVLQKDLRSRFLLQFEEGPITFPPTYKIGIPSLTQPSQVEITTASAFQVGPTASSIAGAGVCPVKYTHAVTRYSVLTTAQCTHVTRWCCRRTVIL
jgi:hypothetical protein